MASYVDSNLLSEEIVKYRASVSKWSLAPLIMIGVVLLPFLGLGLLLFLAAWIKYRTTEFAVTDRRIIAKTGLVSRKTIEMFLDKVESLNVDQGILGRVLDYGSVTIRGTGSTSEPINSISAPLALRKHFMEAADAYRKKTQLAEWRQGLPPLNEPKRGKPCGAILFIAVPDCPSFCLRYLPFPVFADVELVRVTCIEGARLGITVRRCVCHNVLRLLQGAINGDSHHAFGRKA